MNEHGATRYTHDEWAHTAEAVDLEIVQLAVICQVRLLETGVIARVLDNDHSVCGHHQPTAFEKLRGMLYLHYQVQAKLAAAFGAAEAAHIIERVYEHLRPRVGRQLGHYDPPV